MHEKNYWRPYVIASHRERHLPWAAAIGVFHVMAPMARAIADPTLCIYQTQLVKNIGPYLEFHLKYAYGRSCVFMASECWRQQHLVLWPDLGPPGDLLSDLVWGDGGGVELTSVSLSGAIAGPGLSRPPWWLWLLDLLSHFLVDKSYLTSQLTINVIADLSYLSIDEF